MEACEPKCQICTETYALRNRGLLKACDLGLFSYGANCSKLREVLRDVPDRVCPLFGEGVASLGVFVTQEDDKVGG